MKRMDRVGLAVLLALGGGAAQAADSLLRINCDGADAGAEIEVNGKFRGECPLDMKVKAGTLKVRVFKPIDRLRERAFEVDLRMAEDSVKRIDAVLEERFTPAGQAQEDQRLRAEQAEAQRKEAARQAEEAERQRVEQARQAAIQQREAERLRVEQEQLQQLITAAEAGDGDARMRLSERYASGRGGVPQDAEKAAYWQKQALAVGNELALFLASSVSKSSPAEDVEAVKRMLRAPKAEPRILNVRGIENVKAVVASDPFFAMPAGGSGVAFSYRSNPANVTSSGTCQRAGNLANLKGANFVSDIKATFEWSALLGGMLMLETDTNTGMFRNTHTEIAALESVYGSPFPLTMGKRFGVRYTLGSSGTYSSAPTAMTLSCMVTDARMPTSGQVPAASPQLICLTEFAPYKSVARYAFHEASGCAVALRVQQF